MRAVEDEQKTFLTDDFATQISKSQQEIVDFALQYILKAKELNLTVCYALIYSILDIYSF